MIPPFGTPEQYERAKMSEADARAEVRYNSAKDDALSDRVDELIAEQAQLCLIDQDKMRELFLYHDFDFTSELTRIFINLSRACLGSQIHRDAVLSACSSLENMLFAVAEKMVADEAMDQALADRRDQGADDE